MTMLLLIDSLTIAQDSLTIVQDTIAAVTPVIPEATSVDSLILSKQALVAIIEATTNNEPPWTDSTQAFAAIITTIATIVATVAAVVAGYYGWKSYKNTIKQQQDQIDDQQKQLDSLVKIAQGMTDQLNHSREVRRLQIRPNLMLKKDSFSGNKFSVIVENTGDTATDLILFNMDDLICTIGDGAKVLYREKSQKFEVSYKDVTRADGHSHFLFKVYYTDRDGNEYVQTIFGQSGTVHISTPIYLGHSSEWYNLNSERTKKYGAAVGQIFMTT